MVGGIKYHLDYDSEEGGCCYVFDDFTGNVFYDGTIKEIFENIIIDGISFGDRINNDALETFTII